MKSEDFSFASGQPKVLYLEGISRDDYIAPEELADKKFLREEDISFINSSKYIQPIYDKIPYRFISVDDWPTETNLLCWQCGFTFGGKPTFIPTYVRENANGIEFGVKGNMCTFNCAARWIISNGNLNIEDRWRYQDNLNILYFLFTGIHTQIKPAPEKISLKKYGGELSDEEYWEELKKLDIVAGLKDHTPGSIIPERDRVIHEKYRIPQILNILKKDIGMDYPIKRIIDKDNTCHESHILIPGKYLSISEKSIWGLCMQSESTESTEKSTEITEKSIEITEKSIEKSIEKSTEKNIKDIKITFSTESTESTEKSIEKSTEKSIENHESIEKSTENHESIENTEDLLDEILNLFN